MVIKFIGVFVIYVEEAIASCPLFQVIISFWIRINPIYERSIFLLKERIL